MSVLAAYETWTRTVNGLLFLLLLGCLAAFLWGVGLLWSGSANSDTAEKARRMVAVATLTAFLGAATGPMVNWAVHRLYGLNDVPGEVRDITPTGGRPRAEDPSTCNDRQILNGHC